MESQVIKVSAPGKVILHGEHSVVYGKRAIALSVDLRTHLVLTPGGNMVSIELPDIEISDSWSVDAMKGLQTRLGLDKLGKQPSSLSEDQTSEILKFLDISVDTSSSKKLGLLSFVYLYLSILPHPVALKISLTSQLPTGAGLGSSAAYGVCLSAALLSFANRTHLCPSAPPNDIPEINMEDVSAWAFKSEQIVHGSPSGIDNSVCTFGGAVNFKGGSCSSIKIPPLQVLLVNTGVPRSTKALVASVKDKKDRLPNIIDPICNALDALADEGLEILNQLSSNPSNQVTDTLLKTQQELVDINHSLLCALGVSHPSLDRLVGIAKSHGLHAKLTGAGGGGFGLVVLGRLTSEDIITACRKQLEESGYQVWTTCLGSPGITFH